MPKILVAECKQEISSFNPVASHYDDFIVTFGNDILTYHHGVRSEMAGALHIFQSRPDVEIIPTYSAKMISSAGPLAAADFERIAGEFLAAVRAAPPVDGIYFSLHGAMGVENEDDPEGYLLAETRKIVGEQVPIVVSLDLHGILTDRMLQHSDAIAIYHTYPHVDFYQTGERAARLLLRILDEGVKPVTAKVEIPALVRGDELITATGLFGRSIRAAQQIEASEGGLSAGMFIGNPFTDVPALRSNSVVVTDGDPERAEREAIKLAQDFWQVRERLQQPLVSLEEAVAIANATPTGTTILVDAADAPSSGATGDSNVILRALLESNYQGKALIPVVDPQAVQAAMTAGIGAMVHVAIGGAFDSRRFTPVEIDAKVHMLSDGIYRNESNGGLAHAGNTAVLQAGTFTLVVTSHAVSLHDRSLFLAHGQDPKQFNLIVVKCPHCEERYYKAWATRYVNVDAPGATSANLPTLGHTKCPRPIFPLDEGVEFTPKAKIFRRG